MHWFSKAYYEAKREAARVAKQARQMEVRKFFQLLIFATSTGIFCLNFCSYSKPNMSVFEPGRMSRKNLLRVRT